MKLVGAREPQQGSAGEQNKPGSAQATRRLREVGHERLRRRGEPCLRCSCGAHRAGERDRGARGSRPADDSPETQHGTSGVGFDGAAARTRSAETGDGETHLPTHEERRVDEYLATTDRPLDVDRRLRWPSAGLRFNPGECRKNRLSQGGRGECQPLHRRRVAKVEGQQ